VVAAGSGSRSGLKIPKQFLRVAGRSLLEHAVERLAAHPLVGPIVVVVPGARVEEVRRRIRGLHAVVAGGALRQESVRRGLAALGEEKGIVLVHDAARPLVPGEVIRSVIESARRHGSGVPALAPADTVKEVGPSGRILRTLRRERLRLVQTPQAFRIAWLRRAFEVAGRGGLRATDDASMVEAAGYTVRVVEGSPMSFKVTSPEDVARIRALLKG
jgi:2-C-methyl-D-erythritol 4-phosphate cytidylyltransferase